MSVSSLPLSMVLLSGLLLVPTGPVVPAEKLPLWEVAVGGGMARVPDYRGAGRTRTYAYPFVFPFYRGKFFQSDEEGVRGVLFKTGRIQLDFSIDGGVPVDSNKNAARKGMPDLDATVQFGPALHLKLWQANQYDRSVILLLPVRAVYALDADYVGATFSPHLTYYQKVGFLGGRWKSGLSGGLEYGSQGIHDYYYGVDPEYATVRRSAFAAQGGFAGYRFVWTFLRRYPTKWVSLFARYDRIDGAVFEASPLAVKKDGLTVGFVVSWFVKQSKKTVKSGDWKYE